jgi:hypothetical protein
MSKTNATIIKELVNIANQYDWYIGYIDNGRQYERAKEINAQIEKEFVQAAAQHGIEIKKGEFYDYFSPNGSRTTEEAIEKLINEKLNNKEEEIMSTTNNNQNTTHQVICTDHAYYDEKSAPFTGTKEQCEEYVKQRFTSTDAELGLTSYEVVPISKENTTTTNQEVATMKKETLATRILNMGKTERLMYVWDIILHVTKTSHELYIDKGELAQFLFDNDIICRCLGKNELKRTKRQDLVDILDVAVQGLMKAKIITPVKTATTDNNQDGAIRSIIATCCNTQWLNKKQVAKNYISDFMLESCINRTLHGKWTKYYDNKSYVDNTFTDEQKAATQEMKARLLAGPYFTPYKDKGYVIKAEYLAWFYETQLNAHLVYRFTFKDAAKGYIDYRIDRANKTVINLKNNKVSPIDWDKINTTLNFNRVEKVEDTSVQEEIHEEEHCVIYKNQKIFTSHNLNECVQHMLGYISLHSNVDYNEMELQ